jgi:hypothetical protein
MKTQQELNKDQPLGLTRFQEHKEKQSSSIVAQVIISESELAIVMQDYTSDFEAKYPVEFSCILFDLGIDTDKGYQRQDTLQHRNRLNQVVICSRFIGEERQDLAWISSGYASREAKDKYSGSKILEDLYREKSATVGVQEYLEARDRYAVIDESVWA